MLTLCLMAWRTLCPTTKAKPRGQQRHDRELNAPADTGARLKTINDSATMVGSHASGELVNNNAASVTESTMTTTTLGIATVQSMRRMRPAIVVGAVARRARACEPTLLATRAADLELAVPRPRTARASGRPTAFEGWCFCSSAPLCHGARQL